MKIAVLSCIHGNLEALEAVLRDIDQRSVNQIYCLGDLVGYGPCPHEVVDRVRALEIPTCQSCWDEDIVDGLNACECSYPSLLAEVRGRLAHEWTNEQVTPETREYLASLPMTLEHDNLCFVHGSPYSQHEYLLPETSAFMAMERVLKTGADTLFCGHTHVPYVRDLENTPLTLKVMPAPSPQTQSQPASQTPSLKRIINAGSVGEPRHGRPNATYVTFDTETQQTDLREVAYDYDKTCAAILEKGLPGIFAWRLAQGLEYAEKADELTPETPPMQLLDRLLRSDANTLCCGRSGLAFHVKIPEGAVKSTVTTLAAPDQTATQTQTQTVCERQVVGVGSIAGKPGKATYALYSPYTNAVNFRTVKYGDRSKSSGRGFGQR